MKKKKWEKNIKKIKIIILNLKKIKNLNLIQKHHFKFFPHFKLIFKKNIQKNKKLKKQKVALKSQKFKKIKKIKIII